VHHNVKTETMDSALILLFNVGSLVDEQMVATWAS